MNLTDALTAHKGDIISHLKRKGAIVKPYCYLLNSNQMKRKPCLVSHIDTIGKQPRVIIRRRNNRVESLPNEHLGADDRAGVYVALQLAEKYKIPALFCDGEEKGVIGAHRAVKTLRKQLRKTLFFIEFDRANEQDAVFYNDEPDVFVKYILSFGFTRAIGSYTDISVLGRGLGKCAVNLSIGYHNQHTTKEYLDVNALENSMSRAGNLITHTLHNPRQFPRPRIIYRYRYILEVNPRDYNYMGKGYPRNYLDDLEEEDEYNPNALLTYDPRTNRHISPLRRPHDPLDDNITEYATNGDTPPDDYDPAQDDTRFLSDAELADLAETNYDEYVQQANIEVLRAILEDERKRKERR